MILIVAIFFIMMAAFAVVSNPDILSPAKVILFFFFVFHVGALTQEITTLTGALILLVLLTASISVAIEAGLISRQPVSKVVGVSAPSKRDFALWLWLLSVPGVFAQAYMVQRFGGFEGYSRSIAFRVVEWSGFGWARVLISLLTPINIVYFALGLRQRRPRAWWLGYIGHLLIILFFAVLSGSRSSLLNVFVIQTIVYHYVRANVRPTQAAATAGVLVFVALVLDIVRRTAKYTGGQLVVSASNSGSVVGFDSFYYGVLPLEIITRTEHMILARGSTFLSLVTNNIPRIWWPEKPDTGGVFFTKYYAGDAWLGFSNLTPTFLGEWLINFSWAIGIIGFFLSYGGMMLLMNRFYRGIMVKLSRGVSDVFAVDVVIYAHILLTVVGLMVGELTNVILTAITSQLIPLWLIRMFVKRSQPA